MSQPTKRIKIETDIVKTEVSHEHCFDELLRNDNLISEFLNNPENYNFALQPLIKEEESNGNLNFMFVPKTEFEHPLSLPHPLPFLPQQQQTDFFPPLIKTEGGNGIANLSYNNAITNNTHAFHSMTAPVVTPPAINHQPSIPRRKVWWVNQKYADTKGDLVDYVNGIGTLDSFHHPHKKIPSWSRILEARPDDIILHYGKQKIFAVSKMKQVVLDPPQSDGTSVITAHVYSVTKLSSPIPYLLFKEPLINLSIPRGPMNRRQTNQAMDLKFDFAFDNPKHSDYTLVLKSNSTIHKTIHVCNAILSSCSQYFVALFTNDTKETRQKEIEIELSGYESALLYSIIKSLYTGACFAEF